MAITSGAGKGASGTTKPNGKTIKVTLVHSTIETPANHRATVRGLGLRRLHQTVEVEDTPSIRGMIRTVAYLLKCEG